LLGLAYFLQNQTLHDIVVKPTQAAKHAVVASAAKHAVVASAADPLPISVVTFIVRGTKKNEGTRVVFKDQATVQDVSEVIYYRLC
jgi:hypothetical protein